MSTRAIGARIPRNEDPRLLQGLGCFVDDVDPPGMLHAAALRSGHAHARIVRIDATAARRAPGVRLVLTAADLGERNQPSPLLIPHPTLTHARTQRPLATDEVRYVGELVAFVVATDRYLAEDAAALIEVEYEPLPIVTDLARRACTPTSPRTAPRGSGRRSVTPPGRWRGRRAYGASGWRSSAAAAAPSRRAAWWPSGTRGDGS